MVIFGMDYNGPLVNPLDDDNTILQQIKDSQGISMLHNDDNRYSPKRTSKRGVPPGTSGLLSLTMFGVEFPVKKSELVKYHKENSSKKKIDKNILDLFNALPDKTYNKEKLEKTIAEVINNNRDFRRRFGFEKAKVGGVFIASTKEEIDNYDIIFRGRLQELESTH